jgi:hypothetical protein
MLHTHGYIDEGISQKLNLQTEAEQFHQQFERHLKMINVGRNMWYAYNSDVDEILAFKTSKDFKNVSCM